MKIDKKIVSYSVVKEDKVTGNDDATSMTENTASVPVVMTESLKRPDVVHGETYKIKPPEHALQHALYVTINDVILNEGTDNEVRRPFEIFINSKNLEHYQWIVALTLVMSAVFRKGGDVTFLVDELSSVFDPRGGYWSKGKYVPSIIADIGEVVKKHMTLIGMMEPDKLSDEQIKLIEEKRALYEQSQESTNTAEASVVDEGQEERSPFPESATFCPSCNTKALIKLDGCDTCLQCAFSKCQ